MGLSILKPLVSDGINWMFHYGVQLLLWLSNVLDITILLYE